MFARTMADVDGDEDAELRRLERGAADDDAGGLLFEAAALLDGTRGVVRLHPNRLEWISDGAAEASVQLEVAHVASFQQSKAGKPNPKLKVTATPAAGGVSFVFDMTEADPTSTAERDRLRDTLKAQMDAVGLFAAAGASGAARAAGAIGSSGGGGGGLSSAASASSLAAVPPARPHQPSTSSGAAAVATANGAARAKTPPAPLGAGPSAAMGGVKRPRPDESSGEGSRAAGVGAVSGGGGGGGGDDGLAMDGMALAEREAAAALLAQDRDLRALYQALVPSALTATEFWAQRRHLLYLSSQQQGFASRRPSEEERQAAAESNSKKEREAAAAEAAATTMPGSVCGGGGCGGAGGGGGGSARQVSFRLTGAMKLRIFEEFPDVHALFLQKVPQELPEATFWSRYFRSRSAQKLQLAGRAAAGGGSGGSGAGAGGGGGAGEGGSAADALFTSTSRRSASLPDARRQYPDTSAMAGEELPTLLPSRGGYGLAEPGLATIGASGGELHRERPVERSERERREREYNHHGRTVLWGTGAAAAAMTGVSAATMREARTAEARTAWTRLDDLDEVTSPSLVPLPPGLRAAGPRLAAAAAAAADAAAVAAGAPPAPDPACRAASRARLAGWLRQSWVPSVMARPLQPPAKEDAMAVCAAVTEPGGAGCAATAGRDSEGVAGPGGGAGAAAAAAAAAAAVAAALQGRFLFELTEQHERVIECLRFYYTCFPLSHRASRERAAKLHATLTQLIDELTRTKTSLRNAAAAQPAAGEAEVEAARRRSRISAAALQRVNPLLDMLAAATHHYVQACAAEGGAGGAAAAGAGACASAPDAGGWIRVE